MLNNILQYIHEGALGAVGAIPVGRVKGGGTIYDHVGQRYTLNPGGPATYGRSFGGGLSGALMGGLGTAALGGSWGDIGTAAATGGFAGAILQGLPKFADGGMSKSGASLLGTAMHLTPTLGMSGFFIYQGYKENGLTGARDAAVWDIATNAAVRKFGYQTIHPEIGMGATAGAVMSKGMLSHGVRFLGAGIGAQVGQAIGDSIGLPGASMAGAFAGAYVGAAPIQFMTAHPFIAMGAAAVGGLAATGYGAYEVMKMGYAQKQSRRGIQTAGDLAAFNTAGANTMRARAVQAIQKSHSNARSALGQEANFNHYPSKNYFSRYRM